MFRKFLMTATVAVVAALVAPATSSAAFTLSLTLTSGTSAATIDLTTGLVSSGATVGTVGVGQNGYSYSSVSVVQADGFTQVTLNGLNFAGYAINTDTNATNSPGDQSGGILTLTSLNVSRTAGSASFLSVALTAGGYTLPTPQKLLEADFNSSLAQASVNNGAQVTFSSQYDSSSGSTAISANTHLITYANNTVPNTKTLGGDIGSYSLTNTVRVDNLATTFNGGLTSGAVTSTVVAPAPAGLVMAATALPFLGLLRRRLRKAELATAA